MNIAAAQAPRIDNSGEAYGVPSSRVLAHDEWAAFDAMPERIRKRLAEATIEMNIQQLLEYWNAHLTRGYPEPVIERAVMTAIENTEARAAQALEQSRPGWITRFDIKLPPLRRRPNRRRAR